MSPTYALRTTTADDLEALLDIHEGAFRPMVEGRFDWDPTFQRGCVERLLPDSQVILCQDEVVGVLKLVDRGDGIFLELIMLHPRVQGRGLGNAILDDVIAQAAARGLPLTLSVWEENRARHLYERLGFRVTHQVEFKVKMRLDPPP